MEGSFSQIQSHFMKIEQLWPCHAATHLDCSTYIHTSCVVHTAPLPIYVMGPTSKDHMSFYGTSDCDGNELCENITFLGELCVYARMCMHVCARLRMHVCVRMCACISVCVRVHVCAHSCVGVHACMHVYACLYVRTCVSTFVCLCMYMCVIVCLCSSALDSIVTYVCTNV